ncbi:hypothetical protein SAMN05421770_101218 [Granulicella rosea]|uniref:Uncharacterized protein n=1 Tax=Granulicella rosea TaxID=474952 RepID=A0A239D0L3_9BACT|nr:hypothetical protein [Granulicella rosea]SNS25759.1 hypothetical protein SAMN05421770_101218 [Granulicella rosea]
MAASSRWRCCALALLLLVCLRLGAQNPQPDPYSETAAPTPERIATLLKSGDPRDRAWGAFHAVRTKDASFLPELTGLAERWEPLPHPALDHPVPPLDTRQHNELDAMAAVLDGVIQFNGKLSPKVLLALADDLPAQAAVLLSRLSQSEQEPVLMAIFTNPKPANWVETRFSAQMLTLKPPPTFAARLMHDMKIPATIYVVDSIVGGMGSNNDCGAFSNVGKAGWPAAGQYSLRERPASDKFISIPVVRGLHPLYAVRMVRGLALTVTSTCDLRPLTAAVRIELLSQMLGAAPDKALGIAAPAGTTIPATSTAEYEKSLAEFVTVQLDTFQAVERRLTAKGYVSLDEMAGGASEPELVLTLADYRQDKSFELPKIAFNRGRVSWSGQ